MNDSLNESVIKILSSKERSLMTAGVLPKHVTIAIGTLEIDLTIDRVGESVNADFDNKKRLKTLSKSNSLEDFLSASKLIKELFNDKQ
ncbi:hypothetical protein [Levilactobacillus brevis]|uniref:hypothetical protein n=1 Tax=Levilactobacillus brevis TaxID=1580 RepID=UPI001C1EAC79|nr:hypothetical protein [Levilactobacillus brevis]MBU7558893.1 hypothetical protein [Levilactobacillus brevis]MCE6010502.1 hypothetical protein [Levilactobacillus brevis]MCE6025063.1 hypothetical protein [Levilactobacillus brevis]MCE6035836.1 hypothetical protein [Levilactobacillus brevis]